MRVAPNPEAPRLFGPSARIVHPNPRPGRNIRTRYAMPLRDEERGIPERVPVIAPVDPHRLHEACRSGGEKPRGRLGPKAAARGHERQSLERLSGAEEHGFGLSFLPGHDIEAKVEPVNLVNVRVTGRPEHDGRTTGKATTRRVGRAVLRPPVRFNLHDPAGRDAIRAFMNHDHAQKAARHSKGGTLKPGGVHRLPHYAYPQRCIDGQAKPVPL